MTGKTMKGNKTSNSTHHRNRLVYTEGIVSIITNMGLFGLKLWAGIVAGSIALKADAWHTLSDSVSSLIVIIGAKLSSRNPDKNHPFGHGRWEQISAIFIGILLALIAFDFSKDAIQRFKANEGVNFGTLAIVVTIISIVVKEGLAQYAFYVARKTGNSSVKADGWHHRTDALSSLVVLVGIFFAERFWWIDGALGIVIAFMLFYASYEIIRDAINQLLGEAADPATVKYITELIGTIHSGDISPHHFHLHNYTSHQELTFHIKLNKEMTLHDSHQIATAIENKIREETGIYSTVHVEPWGFDHGSDYH